MSWRARYIVIAGFALIVAVGLIGWHFFGGRGEVLKPDGGPVVTVMDFGQILPARSVPLRLAASEILDTFAYEHVLRGQGWRAEHAVRNP
jgi:hypothetical protein